MADGRIRVFVALFVDGSCCRLMRGFAMFDQVIVGGTKENFHATFVWFRRVVSIPGDP